MQCLADGKSIAIYMRLDIVLHALCNEGHGFRVYTCDPAYLPVVCGHLAVHVIDQHFDLLAIKSASLDVIGKLHLEIIHLVVDE